MPGLEDVSFHSDTDHDLDLLRALFNQDILLGEEKLTLPKIVVFGLDDAAGRAFKKVLAEELNLPEDSVDYMLIPVPKRVQDNGLNKEPDKVAMGIVLGANLYAAKHPHETNLIIAGACNTVGVKNYAAFTERGLSNPSTLKFENLAESTDPKEQKMYEIYKSLGQLHSFHHGSDYALFMPIAAVLSDAQDRLQHNELVYQKAKSAGVPVDKSELLSVPFFMGTIVSNIDVSRDIPSFNSEHLYYADGTEIPEDVKEDAAKIIQSMIWLDKIITNPLDPDVPDNFKKLSVEEQHDDLTNYTGYILSLFKQMRLTEVYLGCTELPDIFERFCPSYMKEFNEQLKKINPASLVAKNIKVMLLDFIEQNKAKLNKYLGSVYQ